MLLFPADRLDVIAVGIENKCSIVVRRVAASSKSRLAIICPSRLEGCRMKAIDLRSASGTKSGVLPDTMRVENIDPEHRIVHAVCDPSQILPFVFRRLKSPCDPHDDLQTQRAQSGFVKLR